MKTFSAIATLCVVMLTMSSNLAAQSNETETPKLFSLSISLEMSGTTQSLKLVSVPEVSGESDQIWTALYDGFVQGSYSSSWVIRYNSDTNQGTINGGLPFCVDDFQNRLIVQLEQYSEDRQLRVSR